MRVPLPGNVPGADDDDKPLRMLPVGHHPRDDVWRLTARLNCTACGYTPDAVGTTTKAGNRAPAAGDWSICMRCAEVSIYVISPLGQVLLREPTTDELAEFGRSAYAAEVRRLHRFNAGPDGVR